MNNYYSLPLNVKGLIGSKSHDMCDLNESISHYLHLINTSYFGECTFDESFGCSIWIIDFDNLKSSKKLTGLIQDSLNESIKRHERRLNSVKVTVRMKQEEITGMESSNRIKRRVDITIKARVTKTSEAFSYLEYFYIGPLSY
ncbi:MAG: hypothetical protein ACI840_000438 [Ulvibacter sp.]|jgi:hypothetical protein